MIKRNQLKKYKNIVIWIYRKGKYFSKEKRKFYFHRIDTELEILNLRKEECSVSVFFLEIRFV